MNLTKTSRTSTCLFRGTSSYRSDSEIIGDYIECNIEYRSKSSDRFIITISIIYGNTNFQWNLTIGASPRLHVSHARATAGGFKTPHMIKPACTLSTHNLCRRQLIIHEVCVLDLNRTNFSMATRGSTLGNVGLALVRLCHCPLSEAMQITAFESLWNFEKINAILKEIEYLTFLTEVCVLMLWVTSATWVVIVRFFL